MLSHRRQGSSVSVSSRIRNIFSLRGGSNKEDTSRTVGFAPEPSQPTEEAAPTPHHPAVCAFLAVDRRGSIGGHSLLANSPDAERGTINGGILRAQTCPNLVSLGSSVSTRTGRPHYAGFGKPPARRPGILTPERVSPTIHHLPCCEEVISPPHGILRPSSSLDHKKTVPRSSSVPRPSTAASPSSATSGKESVLVPAQSPWLFLRNGFFPSARSRSPVDSQGSKVGLGLEESFFESQRSSLGDDKATRPILCESPRSLHPPTSSSAFFTFPRSRRHSRSGSGPRLKTADSTQSAGQASSSSSLTASSSLGNGRGVRFVCDVNLNKRYDTAPSSMVPAWYIKQVENGGDGHAGTGMRSLCANCRHIDMTALFDQEETEFRPHPRDFIVLGNLLNLMTRTDCGLCQLAARVIVHDASLDIPLDLTESQREDEHKVALVGLLEETYYLCPVRLTLPDRRTSELYIFRGRDLKSSSTQPRRSMAIRQIETEVDHLQQSSGRLLRNPGEIDFEWVREHLRSCDGCDSSSSGSGSGRLQTASPSRPQPLRAVDVHKMCVVDLSPEDRYVTLSYTWGDADQLLLQRWNHSALRHPRGLLNFWDSIPRTIQDAIKLGREIGERYLWVDALCIVQDDPDDVDAQLAEMGGVFAGSVLTICACCGEDAGHGLPGVEPGTRSTRQVVEMVGRHIVGNVLPSLGPGGGGCGDHLGGWDGVTWNNRAWTLQEHLMSRRKLLITDDCATWWCGHCVAAEDENGTHFHSYSPSSSRTEDGDDDNDGDDDDAPHPSPSFPQCSPNLNDDHGITDRRSNMDIYASIVAEYTRRDLTSPHDAGRAVSGLLRDLEPLFLGTFLSGLPDTELSAALLWCPLGASTRRVDPDTQKPLFPSWSWLGWTGQAAYPWLAERSMPLAEEAGSPLLWRNMAPDIEDPRHDGWFTGYEYRLNGLPHPNAGGRNLHGADCEWREDDEDRWLHFDESQDKDTGSSSHSIMGCPPRWLSPVLPPPEDGSGRPYAFLSPTNPNRLHFRTLSAKFSLEPKVRVRKDKFHFSSFSVSSPGADVHLVRVLDPRGFAAGYVHVSSDDVSVMPPVETKPGNPSISRSHYHRKREFIVLSRSSTRPDPYVGQELLHATPLAELGRVYSMAFLLGGVDRLRPTSGDEEDFATGGQQGTQGSQSRRRNRERAERRRRRLISGDEPDIDELAHFDTRVYDASTPWGLFNVMMIEWRLDERTGSKVAERVGVGRVHVAAFMGAGPVERDVVLE